MKVRVTFIFIIACLFFFVGIASFLLLYLRGQDLLPHDIVFVPKDGQRIDEYTEINGNNFKTLFEAKEILKAAVNPNMVTLDKIGNVMNKTTIYPLYPEDYLTVNHVRENQLIPKQGENEYPIPSAWIEVMDWTGRMGDLSEIWLSPSLQLKQAYTTKLGATINDAKPVTAVPDTAERPLRTPLFTGVRLRYVIDGSNKPVKNAKETDDRSESSGRPAEVKANLTPGQFARIKTSVDEGYKLIVVTQGRNK